MTRMDLKFLLVVLLAAMTGFAPLSSVASDKGLPSADEVLRQLLEHARAAHGLPAGRGYYLCTKQTVTDELDSSWHITSRKVKLGESHPNPREASDASKWSTQNGFNLDEDLLRRFQFTVVERQMLNGRSNLLLHFVPKDPPPPARK